MSLRAKSMAHRAGEIVGIKPQVFGRPRDLVLARLAVSTDPDVPIRTVWRLLNRDPAPIPRAHDASFTCEGISHATGHYRPPMSSPGDHRQCRAAPATRLDQKCYATVVSQIPAGGGAPATRSSALRSVCGLHAAWTGRGRR